MFSKKLVTFLVGAVLVFSIISPGRGLAQTSDLTVQDLQAQIEALLEQIQQLQAQLQVIQGGGSVDGGSSSNGSGPGPTVTLEPSQKFKAGDRVWSTFDLNVRETPGGKSLAVVAPHTKGTIAGGPESANGYYWWRIDYDIKVGGFSVGDFLEKIDVVSPSVSADGNLSPVLAEDAFISPTSVGTNQSNWWKLLANDPEGSQINYKVEWGDGTSDGYVLRSGQSAPAYHWYKQLGTFYLKMTATDQGGASLTRALMVEVIDAASVLPKPSTKFVLGDTVQTTDYLNVRTGPSGVPSGVQSPGVKAKVVGGPVWSIVGRWWWSLDYESGVDGWSAEDWLTKVSGPVVLTSVCGDMNGDNLINQTDLDLLTGYVFQGVSIPTGLKVDLNADGAPDILDVTILTNYLNRGGPAPTCGAITVLSPNGGEVWSIGSTYGIDWDYSGSFLSGTVQVVNLLKGGKDILQPAHLNVGENSFANWTVPVGTNNIWLNTGGNDYKIQAFLVDTIVGRIIASDVSDNNFTIVNPTGLTCGDIDGNGLIDQNDLDNPNSDYDITGYIFGGVSIPTGLKVDLNGDGLPDILDVTVLTNYLKRGGPAPTCTPNNPPVVSSVTKPSFLTAGQLGTWTVLASDLDGDTLAYGVVWGDGTPDSSSLTVPTLNHSYGVTGTYTARFLVSDGKGEKAAKDVVVTVAPAPVRLASGFFCGDIDLNGVINQNDLDNPSSSVDITGYVFEGEPIPAGLKVDLNADGYPDILDVTVLINYLKRGGPAPTCGVTSTSATSAAAVLSSISSQLLLISSQIGSWLGQ